MRRAPAEPHVGAAVRVRVARVREGLCAAARLQAALPAALGEGGRARVPGVRQVVLADGRAQQTSYVPVPRGGVSAHAAGCSALRGRRRVPAAAPVDAGRGRVDVDAGPLAGRLVREPGGLCDGRRAEPAAVGVKHAND